MGKPYPKTKLMSATLGQLCMVAVKQFEISESKLRLYCPVLWTAQHEPGGVPGKAVTFVTVPKKDAGTPDP